MIRDYPPVPTKPELKISWDDPGYYTYEGKPAGFGHFGTVARLANGRIIAVYQEQITGTHGPDDPSRRDVCRTSTDGGYTWSESVVIGTEPRIHMSVCPLQDGSVWLGSVQKPDGKHYIPRSNDCGKTWDFTLEGPEGFVRASQMSNGEIIAASSGVDEDGNQGRAVIITDPEGSKWETIFLRDQCGYQRDEWWITETAETGVLYALMRDQSQANYLSQAWSYDYGRTWHGYSPSGVWFSPRPSRPYVTTLPDGTLVGIHSERGHGRIIAVPSYDEGRNWHREASVVVLDGINGWLTGSHGYCSAAYTDEGMLLVAWYAGARPEMDPDCNGRAFYATHIDPKYFKRPYSGVRLATGSGSAGSSLIGRWSFEDDPPGIACDSIAGNWGRSVRVGRCPGRIGRALHFNGTSSMVEIPDTPEMRVPNFFSIECFFRPDAVAEQQALISKRPFYYLGIAEGRLSFELGDPRREDMPVFRLLSEHDLEPGSWFHAVASYGIHGDGYVRARLYLDGEKIADVKPADHGMRPEDYQGAAGSYYVDMRPESGPLYYEYARFSGYQVDSSMNLHLGVDNSTRTGFFAGDLDEVSLYGRCLRDNEIRVLSRRGYSTEGPGVLTSGPIHVEGHGWGRLRADTDEPAGTTVAFRILDESGSQVLKDDVRPDDSLDGIPNLALRMEAELRTDNAAVTPVLRLWGMAGVIDE